MSENPVFPKAAEALRRARRHGELLAESADKVGPILTQAVDPTNADDAARLAYAVADWRDDLEFVDEALATLTALREGPVVLDLASMEVAAIVSRSTHEPKVNLVAIAGDGPTGTPVELRVSLSAASAIRQGVILIHAAGSALGDAATFAAIEGLGAGIADTDRMAAAIIAETRQHRERLEHELGILQPGETYHERDVDPEPEPENPLDRVTRRATETVGKMRADEASS